MFLLIDIISKVKSNLPMTHLKRLQVQRKVFLIMQSDTILLQIILNLSQQRQTSSLLHNMRCVNNNCLCFYSYINFLTSEICQRSHQVCLTPTIEKDKKLLIFGAGEGIRTLDFNLGKVALYP